MNLLADALPDAIEVAGEVVPIDTDFRAALRCILAFEDEDLTQLERGMVLVGNLYLEPPGDLDAAVTQAIRYLNGGEDATGEDDGPSLRLYAFAKDERLIYAAFQQTHGIDLAAAELHWWQFLALFMDLGHETAFCNLVALRKRVKTGKATKEERAAYREMGESADVPERQTPEERAKEDEFMRLVREGAQRRA